MLENVKSYLKYELEKQKQIWKEEEWSLVVQMVPQQKTETDCGYFAMKFLDFVSRGLKPEFTQEDIKFYKKIMVLEICSKKLLISSSASTKL